MGKPGRLAKSKNKKTGLDETCSSITTTVSQKSYKSTKSSKRLIIESSSDEDMESLEDQRVDLIHDSSDDEARILSKNPKTDVPAKSNPNNVDFNFQCTSARNRAFELTSMHNVFRLLIN